MGILPREKYHRSWPYFPPYFFRCSLIIVAVPHLALLAGLAVSTTLLQRLWHSLTRRRIELLGLSILAVAVLGAMLAQHPRAKGIIEDLKFAQYVRSHFAICIELISGMCIYACRSINLGMIFFPL